jgi:hypothetical protein
MTKLLVGLGFTSDGITNTIEIVNIESTLTTCKNLINFPLELPGSFGGLGFLDKPLICGGRDQEQNISKKCFSLEGTEWINTSSLNSGRYWVAVSPSPYPKKNQKLFVTGGLFNNNTVEVLTQPGWKTSLQTLPVKIYGHCSVLVNSTTVMVIGGRQNDVISSNTYFFNTEHGMWIAGPQLKAERGWHSCGRIIRNSQSQDFSIIVAGGWYQSSSSILFLSSVEILDIGANEWRAGPDLPFRIHAAQMVEDPDGGVVLVGGSADSTWYHDTLYQLPHAGADARWIRMEQKLKFGRESHVAFLVPDDVVDCS